MNYFLTGGTGLIGRRLLPHLLARGGQVHVLLRDPASRIWQDLKRTLDPEGQRLQAVEGDLCCPGFGIDASWRRDQVGRFGAFFHLAALYDLSADEARLQRYNVEGTRNALDLAREWQVDHFHHVSSIAVARDYFGTFTESMFSEAPVPQDPYARSKYYAEKEVRDEKHLRWNIYRPGIVVGDSSSGETSRFDGPYLLFPLLDQLRQWFPPWFRLPAPDGPRLNLVPVDYVAAALDALAHTSIGTGQTFHLTDPDARRLTEIIDLFCQAACAPRPGVRVDLRYLRMLGPWFGQAVNHYPPAQRLLAAFENHTGIPPAILGYLTGGARFDASRTESLLAGTGIEVPPLTAYADRLWSFWDQQQRRLRPSTDRSLKRLVNGKVCLVTGGTSGIGLATAQRLAKAGAVTLIAARKQERIDQVCDELEAMGAEVKGYSVDLSDSKSTADFIARLQQDYPRIDILINNAGHSIRRSLRDSCDRLHDFERTMQLNYFGAVQLTLALLPLMSKRYSGHVINISSFSALLAPPHFAAYAASKAALDAFSRCASAEYQGRGVYFTTLNLPLVRTPMIEPTPHYQALALMDADDAADLVEQAIREKPVRIATGLGLLGQTLSTLAPDLGVGITSRIHRWFKI